MNETIIPKMVLKKKVVRFWPDQPDRFRRPCRLTCGRVMLQ